MPQVVEIRWKGDNVTDLIRAAAARGLLHGAEYVLQQSRERVPIEEAVLERSGVASVDPLALRAAVSYDTPYAVVQHENLQFRHDPGRTAKYLEIPHVESGPVVLALVAAQIRRATT